jgi:outer membrane protein OmpA-like peptidoglycan-associated protein
LWIEDSLIIDNDKYHPMTVKRDSVMLGKGKYPVRVWYYSANELRFGLILRSRALPDSTYCLSVKSKQLVTFDANTVFFEFDSYVISPQGKGALDKICSDLNKQTIRSIQVIGYTDHVGSPEYNEVLSLKRAESIVSYIKSKLIQPGITFKAEGRGALNPADQNADESHLNRRVEIYME